MKKLFLFILLGLIVGCASTSGKQDYIKIGPQNLSRQVENTAEMPVFTTMDQITRPWGNIGLIRIKELPNDRDVTDAKVEVIKKFAAEHGANAIIIKRYFDEDADNNLPVSLAAYLVRYLDAVSEEDKNKMDEFARKIQIEGRGKGELK